MIFLINGTQIHFEYDEPTTNADGTPLVDLDKTRIFYNKGQGPVQVAENPASSLKGGGHIVGDVLIPIIDNEELNVTFWTTALDFTGNESIRSQDVLVRVDRLVPAPPI